MRHLIFICFFMGTSTPWADELKEGWSHESEAAVVQVTGNTETESYSAKQKTSFKKERNLWAAAARYLQTKAASVETAMAWDASLRYEREIASHWSIFLQQGAEHDRFAGYTQRDNSDVGGKYFFIKTELQSLFSELGYRSTRTNGVGSDDTDTESKGRLYVEWSKTLSESMSAKIWAEYIPNFDDSDLWLLNYEPSITAILTKIFSLKVSYLVKHQNEPPAGFSEKEDRTLTTSLVAKF